MAVWDAGGGLRWGMIQFLKYGVPLRRHCQASRAALGKTNEVAGRGVVGEAPGAPALCTAVLAVRQGGVLYGSLHTVT